MNFLMKMSDSLRRGILLTGVFGSIVLMFAFSKSDFSILFFISMSVCLGILIYTNKLSLDDYIKKLENSFFDTLNKNNFKYNDYCKSVDLLSGIAINEEIRKIALLSRNQEDELFKFKEIDFNDVLEVSIYEDGGLVSTVSRGSQVAGALVGGAIAGGVGAIIGGLSGKSKSDEVSNKLSLLIVINDIKDSYHEIAFSLVSRQKNSEVYQERRSELNKWFSKFKVICESR